VTAPTSFRRALEARDTSALLGALAKGAVLHSPATDRLRFTGAELRALLAAVIDAYEDLHIAHESGNDESRTLILNARVGAQEFEETLVLRLDGEDRVEDIHASIRPLAGLLAVMAAVGGRLARRRGRVAEWLFHILLAQLRLTVAIGDRLGARLAGRQQ
jgi:hypothetical protein